jgi:coenzyme Q-binding protein COQ10
MPTHAEKRILPYTAEQMAALVADVEKYPEFLPWVRSVKILDRGETSFTATLEIGYKIFRETYTSMVTILYPHRIDVTYLKGPFKYLNNHWVFNRLEGDRVEIDFYIDFEFHSSFLQSLLQPVFKEAVKMMIATFEKRAESLYGKRV